MVLIKAQGEITPVGPDLDFEAPHDRDRLSGEVPETISNL